MEKMSSAHIGGHITLFFTVEKEGRLLRNQGSRGVGINIVNGVEVTVTLLQDGDHISESTIEIIDFSGNQLLDSEQLYRKLIDELVHSRLLNEKQIFDIKIKLELPTSQGFGMSAAGLIALSTAFRELTGLGTIGQYYRICHRIERIQGSGLGDVLGIHAGGVEMRLQPGAPGASGRSLGFKCNQPIIIVWNNHETRHTSEYIDDIVWQNKISRAGHKALNNIKQGPWNHSRWKDILDNSLQFCQESELAEETDRRELLEMLRQIVRENDLQTHLRIRLCMLGISAVILPRKLNRMLKPDELKKLYQSFIERDLGALITKISS